MVVICLPTASLTGTQQERDRHAVDVHGAGAALRDAAAVFGAGQADLLPQHPQQWRIGIDVDIVDFPLMVRRAMLFLPGSNLSLFSRSDCGRTIAIFE